MDIPPPPPGFEPVGGGMPPPPPGFEPVPARATAVPPPPPGFEPVQPTQKVGVMDVLRQAGTDIKNAAIGMLHLPEQAGEASEAWRQGERTPENAGTMLGAAATGLKLGKTPGVVSPEARAPMGVPGEKTVVAATVDGKLLRGIPGETHADMLERHGVDLDSLTNKDNTELFVLPNGEVVNRPVMAARGLAETGEDLRDFGLRPTKEQMATAPGSDARTQAIIARDKVPPPPAGFEPVPADLGAAASGAKPLAEPVTKPEVASVADDLNRLRGSGVADRAEIANRMEATPPEFKDPALQEKFYNAIENPAEIAKLSPPERALFDQHIQPMRAELSELYNKVKQYGGEDRVADPTYVHRIAKGHAPAYDTLSGDAADPITGTRSLNRTTSALQGRKFFALEDEGGNRFVVSKGDGASTIWTKGKPTKMTTELDLRPGTEVSLGGKTFDVKQATTNEIEANSDVRYHKNAAVNTADALVRMREVARNLDYLEKVKSDLFDSGRAMRVNGNRPVPDGFAETKIPQLRGWAFDKKIAAAFDDFYKPGIEGLEGLRKINQFATASLFWQPLPHIENVAWHWYTGRGFDWVRPGPTLNFVTDATRAIKEVATQGPEYQRLLREGNGVIYGGIKQADFFRNLGKSFGMDVEKNWGAMKPVFDKLGFVGKNAYEATAWWYDKMRNTLWAANDMFMLHRVFELERKGMPVRAAIKEAEKDIPSYRIPSEVLNSRQVSKIMQSPEFLVFMRYHYGQWKAYANTFGDLIKGGRQEGTGASERVEAVGKLAATGFAMFAIIPALNYILQKLTGDPNAKKLMRGSLSIPDMVLQLALGDKTGGESVQNVFTAAPVTKEILQQGVGRDFFSGSNIGGPVPRIEHAAKSIIAPYNTLAQATDSNPGARTAGRMAFDTLAGAANTSERTRGAKEYFKGQRAKEDAKRYERPTGPITKGYKTFRDYLGP